MLLFQVRVDAVDVAEGDHGWEQKVNGKVRVKVEADRE